MRDDAEADESVRNHINMETIIASLADSSLGVVGSTDWSTVSVKVQITSWARSKDEYSCNVVRSYLTIPYSWGSSGRTGSVYYL